MTHSVTLGLLDGFELRSENTEVQLPLSTQRLIAFLALARKPLGRGYIAGKLWFDGSQEHASASLRSAVWRARRGAPLVLETTRSELRLSPAVAVDVNDQTRVARSLLHGSVSTRDVDYGILLRGELLPDWYDEWVAFERERLRQLRLHALEALADRLIGASRYGEAVEVAMAAVHADPVRQSAARALIRSFLAEGNVVDAVRCFDGLKARMARRLGIEPSPELAKLIGAAIASSES